MLLDEPFGALDSLTRTDLQNWLKAMWADHDWTALLITHDVREAVTLSDRVVVLGPRPAVVREIVDVDKQASSELELHLLELLHER